jgi:hypothetical protein
MYNVTKLITNSIQFCLKIVQTQHYMLTSASTWVMSVMCETLVVSIIRQRHTQAPSCVASHGEEVVHGKDDDLALTQVPALSTSTFTTGKL